MPAGAAVALVGLSGIGKTTLLRIVAGLEGADSGEVWIRGQLATQGRTILVPPHSRGVGLVFQDLAHARGSLPFEPGFDAPFE